MSALALARSSGASTSVAVVVARASASPPRVAWTRARVETSVRSRVASRGRGVASTRRSSARRGDATSRAAASHARRVDDEGGDASAPAAFPARVTVEAAMLAALTGLTFHVSSLFRFDAYFGALFPLPVVIACARWGDGAARRTLLVATLLLLLISGPMRALNYFFLHGALAYVLSALWSSGATWWVTVPVSAITRTIGILCSLTASSLLYRENVMKLLVTQMYSLLDQFAANIGANFAPDMAWVWATAMVLIMINSFSYTLILHMVYTIVLGAVTRRNFVNAPAKVSRALGVPF